MLIMGWGIRDLLNVGMGALDDVDRVGVGGLSGIGMVSGGELGGRWAMSSRIDLHLDGW